MMCKKYEILENETKVVDGHILHRIKALKNFGDVKIGKIGGWIETEENLSQDDNCFIYDNAHVYENARIFGDARVYGDACVSGEARVYEKARIFENACVYGDACVHGSTCVYGNAHVFGSACVYGSACVFENACVYGDARVFGYAYVYRDAVICESMRISQADVMTDLSKNLKESIRCQTELGVFNNKVIAYKQVNKDLTSLYDPFFKYVVGEIVETEIEEEDRDSRVACGSGLHFSNMNYWNRPCSTEETVFLIAEINLDDIIAVQEGKIRCKKAKILGVYEI